MKLLNLTKDERVKIIARIKACLELSKDGHYPEEADAAMRAAKRLMAKHNLSIPEVELFNSVDNASEGLKVDETTMRHRWDYNIVLAVSTLCYVKPTRVATRKKGKWKANVTFIGYKQDACIAKEIYLILRASVVLMGITYSRKHKKRSSYLLGLTECLKERAKKEAALTKEEKTKYGALVVVKEKNITTWIKKNTSIKGAHKPRLGADVDARAYFDGEIDGRGVSLENKKTIK